MEACQTSFISSTYWTEGVGPTAALATIRKMQSVDLLGHINRIGNRFRAGWLELGRTHGVPVKVGGHPVITTFGFDHPDAAALGTLFTTKMLDLGFMIGSGLYPSLAHQDRHVDACMAAAGTIFPEIAEAVQQGNAASRLKSPVRHSGFARLT